MTIYLENFLDKFFDALVKVLQFCFMCMILAGMLRIQESNREIAQAEELLQNDNWYIYSERIPLEECIERDLSEKEIAKAEIPKEKIVEKENLDEEKVEISVNYNNELSKKVAGITPTVRNLNTSSYCACEECCGKTDGITASGELATAWYTVAAGKGYKMGTIIYIPALADKPNQGWFIVQDRGGAISDDKLDIYLNTHSEALQYGRKTWECYIYEF